MPVPANYYDPLLWFCPFINVWVIINIKYLQDRLSLQLYSCFHSWIDYLDQMFELILLLFLVCYHVAFCLVFLSDVSDDVLSIWCCSMLLLSILCCSPMCWCHWLFILLLFVDVPCYFSVFDFLSFCAANLCFICLCCCSIFYVVLWLVLLYVPCFWLRVSWCYLLLYVAMFCSRVVPCSLFYVSFFVLLAVLCFLVLCVVLCSFTLLSWCFLLHFASRCFLLLHVFSCSVLFLVVLLICIVSWYYVMFYVATFCFHVLPCGFLFHVSRCYMFLVVSCCSVLFLVVLPCACREASR